MKIRSCELSSLGPPVFCGTSGTFRPHLLSSSLGSSWGLDPAETLGMSQSTGWAQGMPGGAQGIPNGAQGIPGEAQGIPNGAQGIPA